MVNLISEELEALRAEFEKRSRELFELYKKEPVKDGHVKEDIELRRWYEAELKRIYSEHQ